MAGASRIERHRAPRSALLTLLVLMALAMAACGVKNAPELPPGEEDQYPRQYPAPDEP